MITSQQMNPGLDQTVQQTMVERPAAEARAAAQQEQARQFILEHGAAASDGHTVRAAEVDR